MFVKILILASEYLYIDNCIENCEGTRGGDAEGSFFNSTICSLTSGEGQRLEG